MLRQRLITAAVLVPLVIWAILALESSTLVWVFAAVGLIGAWEWSAMIGLRSVAARAGYVGFVALVLALVEWALRESVVALLALATLWWLVAAIRLRGYRGEQGIDGATRRAGIFVGVAVIVPWWLAMSHLHAMGPNGPWWVLFLIALVAVADSGAYFAGRRWGRHKLAPMVSPGKTIEGVAGALVAAALVAVAGGLALGLAVADLLWFVPLALLVVAISVVGDLEESLYKRRAGLKDSGHILPGHGGILDRIDSHTAAAPLFALGLTLFGIAQ